MPVKKRTTKSRARRAGSQPRQVVLHIALDHIEPPVWRRVRVPESSTLHQVHRVIQFVFGWLDYHLYLFEIGGRRFQHPLAEMGYEPALEFTLEDLQLKAGQRFTYTYDFGDDWRHTIKVESFAPMPGQHDFDWTPRLVDGARAAPPEDIGGPPGYAMVLESIETHGGAAPQEYQDILPPGFEPDRFDRAAIDRALALVVAWGAI